MHIEGINLDGSMSYKDMVRVLDTTIAAEAVRLGLSQHKLSELLSLNRKTVRANIGINKRRGLTYSK